MIGGRSSLLLGLCLTVLVAQRSMAQELDVQARVPYLGSVRSAVDGSDLCAATIIGKRTLAGSAECIENLINGDGPLQLDVTTGTGNSAIGSPDTQVRQVSSILVHDGYVSGSTSNAIALVYVSEPFKYTAAVHYIQLPQANSIVGGVLMIKGLTDSIVQGVYATVIPDTCNAMLPSNVIDDVNFCTVSLADDGGICAGGLGSPTVQDDVLVGISVWNPDPCQDTL